MKHLRLLLVALLICMVPCMAYAEDDVLSDTSDVSTQSIGTYDCIYCGWFLPTINAKVIKNNAETHTIIAVCPNPVCGKENRFNEAHEWSFNSSYEQNDQDTHYVVQTCSRCGEVRKTPEIHSWSKTFTYAPCDKKYHYHIYECSNCKAVKKELEEHDDDNSEVTKYATLKEPGTEQFTCWNCNQTIVNTFPWKYGDVYSADYDLDHSAVYRNSKSVTVKLKKGLKGGVVKVKIGKKTYTKKLKNNSKKVKIKIKQPKKYGQKVKITLNYKGKVVGKDKCQYWDVVWYAKAVRVGMTMKQCKYTWGVPDHVSNSSNGFTHWNWNNGDYLRFRNGKLDYWYTNS